MMNEIQNILKQNTFQWKPLARVSSLLMKRVGLLMVFLLLGFKSIFSQTTLVTWNFPNDPDNATCDGGIAANSTKAISTVGGTSNIDYNNNGATTNAANATGWDNGNGAKYWLIDIVTTGYQNITVSSAQRGRDQGGNRSPRDFRLEYNVGSGWIAVTGGNITVANDFTTGVLDNVPLPTECENVASLKLRWIMTSNTSIGGNTVNANGYDRIDDIIIRGSSCTPSQPSPIIGTATPCLGSSQVYSVTNVAGVTYSWSFPAGWSQTAGGTTNSVTVTTGGGSGNITVTPSNACGNGPAQTLAVTMTSADDQTTAGNNSWIGHVYDGINFNDYVGHYTENEIFDQNFGGDANCFNVTSSATTRSIFTETFSARYRMNSSKKGLYVVDMGSDDGVALTVDGVKVYNQWVDRGYVEDKNILMSLSGSSSLIFEYYENGGQNRVSFKNLTQVISNTLSSNLTQTFCSGSSGLPISGDIYGTLPAGISLSGTGYQWTYSTTPGGARTVIAGVTGANFTPTSSVAPFNTPGTYYVFRNAVLSSANNISPNPYVSTNESNAAIITVAAIPSPAGAISGASVVTPGQIGVAYSVPVIANATSYSWSYSGTGATINGTGNAITINFAANVTSGNLTVKGTSPCGEGTISANFPVTVNSNMFTVTPTNGLITTEAGGTATFTVKLNIRPSANVTISLSSDDISEGTVTPASLTFTNANWNTAQTVTVRGVDDNFIDGIINYHVITAAAVSTDPVYNGSAVPDVDVANTDDDAVPAGSIEVDRKEPEGEMNASQLVQNVLIKGCLKASNVQFNRNLNAPKSIQLGYFNKGTSDFPLSEGIIMSTGEVRDAEGPNIDPDKTTQVGSNGDNDINTITGRTSYDAAVLEFDFVPAGNKVQFNYIFASEEYGEYIGANYNDAFAFLISGPGITGTKNIALIPNTTTPVSINNVHGQGYTNPFTYTQTKVYDANGYYTDAGGRYYYRRTPTTSTVLPKNETYYVDNGQFGTSTVMNGTRIQYVNVGGGGPSTEFDGRTTVLTATQDVQACQTYHIKLVVADVGDDQYNSGVFLEAKSFTSNEVKVENLLMGADDDKDMMYEGCTNSFIRFVRNEESNINEAVSFDVQISGTATNGVDYKYVDSNGNEINGGYGMGVFPSKATIPVGQQYVDYYYKAAEDGIQESNETAIFQVVNSCPCDPVVTYFTKTVTIIDAPKIQATATANVQCGASGTPVATVNVNLQSGMDPNNYLFSFDGGAFQSSNLFTGNWPVGSSHTVQVKDKFSCQSATNSITIPSISAITANAGADKEMCRLQTGVQLNGSGGIYYEWSSVPAIGVNYLSDKNIAQPTVNPNIPSGTYTFTLLVQDQAGSTPLCSGTDDMVLTVKSTPIITATADTYEACSGTRINLNTSVTDGVAPLTYSWNPSAELSSASVPNPYFTPVVTGLSSRSFTVTVGNANGCSNTAQISNITINPAPLITINSVNKATCTGNADGSATITASGGTPGTSPAYTYTWKNSSNVTIGTASGISGLVPGAYTINVMDGKSCSSSQTINIGIFETVPPVAKIKNPTIQLDASGNATISSIDIDNGSYDLCGPVTLSLNKTAFTCANLGSNNVVLTVTDASGNISTATAVVTIQNPFAPALSSSLNPSAVCSNTVLNYTPTSTTAGTTFAWSRAAVAGISNAAATGTDNPNETLINTSSSTVNVTYVYSLAANGCTNPTTFNVVVPVKSLPKLSSTLLPSVICSNDLFTYTPTSLSTGATFSWSRASVAGISNLSGSGNDNPNEILYGTSKSAVNVIYVFTTTANGCSNSENVTVTVNPLPVTGPVFRQPNN